MASPLEQLPLDTWELILEFLAEGRSPEPYLNLYMTSRAICVIITPRIYQHIRLSHAEGVRLLERSLSEKKTLAQTIQSLTVDADLEDGEKADECLFKVLSHTVALRTLKLSAPQYYFLRLECSSYSRFFNRVRNANETFLTNVETIRLSRPLHLNDFNKKWVPQGCGPFLSIASFQQLISLEAISLEGHIDNRSLCELSRTFPKLKRYSILRRSSDPPELDGALSSFTSLEELNLVLHRDIAWDRTLDLGSARKLTILPNLCHLRSLTTSVHFFLDGKSCDVRPEECFPTSLTTLVLYHCGFCSRSLYDRFLPDWGNDINTTPGDFEATICLFARLSSRFSTIDKLKSVRYIADVEWWENYRPAHEDGPRDVKYGCFTYAKNKFQEKGVVFEASAGSLGWHCCCKFKTRDGYVGGFQESKAGAMFTANRRRVASNFWV